jgi:hypothetical protein
VEKEVLQEHAHQTVPHVRLRRHGRQKGNEAENEEARQKGNEAEKAGVRSRKSEAELRPG